MWEEGAIKICHLPPFLYNEPDTALLPLILNSVKRVAFLFQGHSVSRTLLQRGRKAESLTHGRLGAHSPWVQTGFFYWLTKLCIQ
jgi:hypothetical protein